MLNPEIRKHIWLDVSIAKLVIIPLTALLMYAIINPLAAHADSSLMIFYYIAIFFIYIWGLHNASSTIPQEFNQRTWEFVKQSAIGAWRFTWGKLLGSTLLAWYGAFIFLLLFMSHSPQANSFSFTKHHTLSHMHLSILVLIIGGIFAQSLGMLLSLNSLPDTNDRPSTSFWFFIIILFIASWTVGGTLSAIEISYTITWYGQTHQAFVFSFTTLLLFTAFSILGLYRSVKATFQYTIYPWAWALFNFVLILYFSGFSPDFLFDTAEMSFEKDWQRLFKQSTYYIALGTSLILTYFVLFSKTINKINYNKFLQYLRANKIKACIANMPLWLISLAFVLVCWALCMLFVLTSNPSEATLEWYSPGKVMLFLTILVTMLSRDIMLHHYLAFGKQTHQRGINTLFYLFLLYFLIPWALAPFTPDILPALFVPDFELLEVTLLSFIGQNIALFVLTQRRWKQLWTVAN